MSACFQAWSSGQLLIASDTIIATSDPATTTDTSFEVPTSTVTSKDETTTTASDISTDLTVVTETSSEVSTTTVVPGSDDKTTTTAAASDVQTDTTITAETSSEASTSTVMPSPEDKTTTATSDVSTDTNITTETSSEASTSTVVSSTDDKTTTTASEGSTGTTTTVPDATLTTTTSIETSTTTGTLTSEVETTTTESMTTVLSSADTETSTTAAALSLETFQVIAPGNNLQDEYLRGPKTPYFTMGYDRPASANNPTLSFSVESETSYAREVAGNYLCIAYDTPYAAILVKLCPASRMSEQRFGFLTCEISRNQGLECSVPALTCAFNPATGTTDCSALEGTLSQFYLLSGIGPGLALTLGSEDHPPSSNSYKAVELKAAPVRTE